MDFKIDDIRAMLAIKMPLFIKFLVDTPFVVDEKIKTLATDGTEVRYNPAFVQDVRSRDYQVFYFAHELGHIFLGHHVRYHEDWDNDNQQVAADIAVNSILLHSDFQLPANALYEHKWSTWSFEEIYRAIESQEQPLPPRKQHNTDKHGEVEPDPELGNDDKENTEDQLQGSQKTTQKQQELIDQHQQKMQESIQMAKMAGNLPGAIAAILDKLTEAEINWKDAFAEFLIRTTGMDDYTFSRPNKKSDSCDVILPSMWSERGPIVAFAGDTSCSVSLAEIKEMASEIIGMVEEVEPEELHVMWCDTRIQFYQFFGQGELPDLQPKGRGGTDFKPPFIYLDEKGIEPDVLVYMTDGECSSFPPAPHYPVLWLVWQNHFKFKPPFGEVLIFNKR